MTAGPNSDDLHQFETTAASAARSRLIVLTPNPPMFVSVSKVTGLIAKELRGCLICLELVGCVQL